jgi:hypothetical protein
MCAVACFGWSRKKSEKGTPKKKDGFSSGQDMHLLSQNLDNFRVVLLGWGWPFCLVSPQMLENLKAQKLTMLNKGAKLPSQKQQSFGTDSASEPIANLMWQKSEESAPSNCASSTNAPMCLGVCVSAVLEYFQWTRRVPQPGQARVPHIYDANGQRLRSSGLGGLALGFATILNHHLPNQHWSPLESLKIQLNSGTPSSWDRHHRYLTSKRSMVEKNGEKLAKKGEILIKQSLLSSRAYITHLLHNILSLWRLGTLTSHSQTLKRL